MEITFDIRTAYLITALTSLICAAMLFASRRLHRPSTAGVAWSSGGWGRWRGYDVRAPDADGRCTRTGACGPAHG